LAFREEKLYRIIAGACIVGGGMGNLIDRIINNFFVIDFLNFGIGSLRTGILNIADISVTFGALFFLFYELRDAKKLKLREQNRQGR
jgi:signal peptidase II